MIFILCESFIIFDASVVQLLEKSQKIKDFSPMCFGYL